MNGSPKERFTDILQDEPRERLSDDEVVDQSQTKSHPGEEILRHLGDFPPDYHVSAEHKILFDQIEERVDTSNFPITLRDNASFTALGLEYGAKRLPYKLDVMREIHDAALTGLEDGSVEQIIEKENLSWIKPIKNSIASDCRADAAKDYSGRLSQLQTERKYLEEHDTYKTHRKEIRQQIETNFIKNGMDINSFKIKEQINKLRTSYIKQERDEFALTNNLMTGDEIKSYYSFRDDKNLIIEEMRRVLRKEGRVITGKTLDYLKLYTKVAGIDELTKIKESFPHLSDKELDGVTDVIIEHRMNLKNTTLNNILDSDGIRLMEKREAKQNLALMEKRVIKGLSLDKIDSPELLECVSQIESLSRNYYGHILPKYIFAQKLYEYYWNERWIKKNDEYLLFWKNREDYIDRETAKRIDNSIQQYKSEIIGICFSDLEEKPVDLLILPTGISAIMRNGSIKTKIISPLDDRICKMFKNKETLSTWKKIWESKVQALNPIALKVLNGKLKNTNKEQRDPFDGRVEELLRTYQIGAPKPLSERSGNIYDSMQPKDVETLEKLLPFLGKFIKKINLSCTDKKMTLGSTRLETIRYLSGNGDGESLSLVRGDCNLNLREVKKLFEVTSPEKEPKAFSRVIAELGISLYNSLKREDYDSFLRLMGDRINISEADFYRQFKNSVSDARERQDMMGRILFLREFNTYLAGVSSGTIKEFFEGLEKKTAINGE